ncbi:MAG: thiamine pyrophosphate-dependent enzyme [Candidatus Zophobacter franzmannii]|nr:thiamine pyrophosphate-dependent enzyme [Candidatus Zophobacter franzmannii]
MGKVSQRVVHDFLRHDKKFPHVWCSGCSNGTILGTIIRAIAEQNLDRNNITMVSGIGCSSRMPVYIDLNTLHSLHGRAIAFATGIKTFKPDMKVIVVTGDGDSTAIGGNHLIHAARRNIDMTVIVVNNNIYGMTGGQYSPTTPDDAKATTSPYGNFDRQFDICDLVIGAGATYVARSSAFHTMELQKMIVDAMNHKGFSIIDVISACPVIYGRMNKKGGPPEMMQAMRDNTVLNTATAKLPPEKLEGKTIRGVFKNVQCPEYCEQYAKVVEKIKETSDE